MTCLKDETLAALARGVIPQGELGRIRAHLPECPRCLDAVARRSRRPTDARRAESPPTTRVAPAPEATTVAPSAKPRRRRGWAVVATAVTLALAGLWLAPAGIRAGADGALARIASAARGAATGADARDVWRTLRGVAELPPPRAEDAATGAPQAASRAQEPLLREESAASARIAEASRLVERSNAAAAPNQAAGGP